MEDLFLGTVLSAEELHIVYQQAGWLLAVAVPEFGHPAVAKRVDELIGELLSRHVQNACLGISLPDAVSDGVEQVGLP